MPHFIKNINEVRLFVRKTLLESVSKIKSNEYNKPYRFYMLCDKLCNIEGVEVKNKMIADASPISRKTFEKNCAYASELFESESQMADDPSHGFYKSNVKGVPCLYMQYVGFEFIFLKDYKGGKEYWLDELNEVTNFVKKTLNEMTNSGGERYQLLAYSDDYNEDFEEYGLDEYEVSERAHEIAKNGGVTILRDKNLNSVLVDLKEKKVIGGLWVSQDHDKFSFDIALDSTYQNMGLSSNLIKQAISEYEMQKEMYGDDLVMEVDVINPKLAEILKNKYGFYKVGDLGPNRVLMSLNESQELSEDYPSHFDIWYKEQDNLPEKNKKSLQRELEALQNSQLAEMRKTVKNTLLEAANGMDAYKKWKRNNVMVRGISSDGTLDTANGAGARFGDGLYTAPLSNKSMAKGYGKLYFVVNGKPKNPMVFKDTNLAEIWIQQHLIYNKYKNTREFNANTSIKDEMLKLGYDGIEIKGRETVNFTPDNIMYFATENGLIDYFEHTIENKIDESLNEDYPSHFDMEHFKSLKTFAQRIQYCDANLKRIGGGSSRIVFKIDDQKVLKLAKNKKGIVQNDTEIDRGNDTYYSSILAQVFDSDDDGLWVEMELATPINKYEFYRLTNFDLKDVGNYLINFQSETNGRGIVVHQQKPLVDRLVNDEFIQLLRDFVAGTDALAGDLGVATSYGLVKRNGHQELVIIDFGLTDRDYEKLYRESIEKKETGSNLNDNFFKWFAGSKIADASGNPIPVHHGTSKKFSKFNIKKGSQPIIWFTSNKSAIEAGEVGAAGKGHIMDLYVSIKNPAGWDEYEKYGLGQLKERGYDGVILPESDGTFTGFVFEPTQLKSVKNKGEWNPNDKNIYKEVTELDEAHHREEEWKKEIAQVAKQLKVELTNFIGAGVWGIAYEIPGNKVIKITEDDREVENAKHLVGKKNKFMADIYKVYSIGRKKEQESSPFRFSAGKKIIVMEKLMPLESVRPMLGKVINFSDAFDEYSSEESSWSEMLENGWDEDFDNYLRKQNKGLEDVYSDLLAIYEEATSKGIYLTDMHQENFGIKNGHLAIFDIT